MTLLETVGFTEKCSVFECNNSVFSKVIWIGKITWTGLLCQKCIDEMWQKYKGLISSGQADIILEKI